MKNTTKKLVCIGWAAILLLCQGVSMAYSQSLSAIRINEVLVDNETNFQDDYGNRGAWIEIYNASSATIDVKGCFLTNDPNNLKKYPIPSGDVDTQIPPRQHRLFWADSRQERGTFHTSFSLEKSDKDQFVAFVASDGVTILDEVVVPAGLPQDKSYARSLDGVGALGDSSAWMISEVVTPLANNKVLDSNKKIETLKQQDSFGVVMTITAMLVVFCGLALLFICYKLLGMLVVRVSQSNAQKETKAKFSSNAASEPLVGDVSAAICLALSQLQEEQHDEEWGIITIHRTERKYSPWSSKIYNMRTPLEKQASSPRKRS